MSINNDIKILILLHHYFTILYSTIIQRIIMMDFDYTALVTLVIHKQKLYITTTSKRFPSLTRNVVDIYALL